MQYCYDFTAFTSPCELRLFGENKAECDTAATAVLHEVKRLESKYNFFTTDSIVGLLNRRTSNIQTIDKETKSILKEVLLLCEQTDFAFDIAAAGTLKGCYKAGSLQKIRDELHRLFPFASSHCFELKADKIRFTNPHTKLDFGGVIKEYAIDSSVKILHKNKIKNALVDFGGDMFALGTIEDRSWRIAIKNPQEPQSDILTVQLCNEALTTSGHYERYEKIEGETFSHIPSLLGRSSRYIQASAMCYSALKAGVFSTALLIDGQIKVPCDVQVIVVDEEYNIRDLRLIGAQ